MERRVMDPSAPGSKPVATLMPHLLARKGGARPAMRSPLAAALEPAQIDPVQADPVQSDPVQADPAVEALDDLGWNDMDGEPFVASRVIAFPRPAASRPRPALRTETGRRPRGAALADGGKAAFTLRLDAERHLKLRIACTLDACSAQTLVTDALDRLLAEMPDLEAMAQTAAHPARAGAGRPRRQS
jgi:hypothetical protein